jgi:threonine synthase
VQLEYRHLATILGLAQKARIYAEPAAAAGLASLKKMVQRGDVGKDDRVLVIISGSGLKDPNSSIPLKDLDFPCIGPSLPQLENALLNK